jgi:predicted MPP superfamily phosphohydrolase
MKIEIAGIAWMALSGLAGFCVSLMLLNRRLILMRESSLKGPLILLTFAIISGGFAVAGFAFPGAPWAYVPTGVLLLIVVGELRRAVLRRAYAGSPPLDTVPHKIEYLRPFTTTDVATHRFSITLADWRGAAFRIAHLSDLHVSPHLSIEYYRGVFELVEQTQPDLVFLTGDFVTKAEATSTLARILRPLGKWGTFAVLGNHDYWAGAETVRPTIRKAGITLLTDQSVRVRMDGGDVQITGCDYPWGMSACRVPDPGDGVLQLVLSHTPDNIYRISKQSAHCVFSGHYHAGQMRIPFLGPVVVPSAYGRRFDHGHFVVDGTHLFVASGIGAASPPFRLYCQPDIFVVDVNGAPKIRTSMPCSRDPK